MRILVLIHEYPPIGGGGGRVARDLCQDYARMGHEVTVLTARLDDQPAQEIENGVKIMRLASGRKESFKAGLGAMFGYILAAIWHGLKLIKQQRPDVIHVHFAVPAGAAAYVLSLLTKVPYVLTAHLGDVPGGVPDKTGGWFRWVKPFTPPIWKRAAAVVAVSEFTRSLALAAYPVPVKVIFNGVDLAEYDPGVIQVNTPPRIIFAGRFVSQKNPLGLVRMLADVQDLPWQCIMIGDGAMRPQIEAEIAAHGLGERFTLPGWVDPEVVLDWYRKGDLFLMPSLSEGLPVAGVQAMAMGLALVMSDIGGCVDLVENGVNGWLVPPSDQPGFATALRSLLSDPAKLLSARLASRRLAQKFDLETITSQYEAVLAHAAAGADNAG